MLQSKNLKIKNGVLISDVSCVPLSDIRSFEVRETLIRQAYLLWPAIFAGIWFVIVLGISLVLEIPGLKPEDAPSLADMIGLSFFSAVMIFVGQLLVSCLYCVVFLPKKLRLFTDYGHIEMPVKDLKTDQVRDMLIDAISQRNPEPNNAVQATRD